MASSSRSRAADGRIGLSRRLASIAYDLLLVTALLMVVTGFVFLARGGSAFDPRGLWFRILLLTGWWAYFAWSWASGGQTVGMRAWRLVVTHRDGTAVSLITATLRFLAACLSALAFGLGFIWCLIDRDGLTWHDRISGTVLVLRSKLTKPENGEQGDQQ